MLDKDPQNGSENGCETRNLTGISRSGCLFGAVAGGLLTLCGILVVVLCATWLWNHPCVLALVTASIVMISLGVKILLEFMPTTTRFELEITRRIE